MYALNYPVGRGGSRISGKGVHMYKFVCGGRFADLGGRFADFISIFLNIP